MSFVPDHLKLSSIFGARQTRAARVKNIRRQAVLETLEGRLVMNASVTIDAANALVFNGDTNGGEVDISFTPNMNGGTYTISDPGVTIDLTDNGTGTSSTGGGSSIVMVTGLSSQGGGTLSFIGQAGDADVFDIASIDNPATVDVVGTGSPFYNIGTDTEGLSGIGAPLTLHDTGGFANVNIDDLANTNNTAATLNATGGFGTLNVPGAAPISYLLNDMNRVAYQSGSGNDSLTVDFSTGDPIPQDVPGGFAYNGDDSDNTLNLVGGSFASEEYDTLGAGTGHIIFTGTGANPATSGIFFTGLKPVNDTVTSGSLTVNAVSDTVNVVNGPVFMGAQTGTISSGDVPAAFELINYANKANVVVNGSSQFFSGSGPNFIVDNPVGADGLTNLTVNGSNQGDQFQIRNTPGGVTTAINGNAGDDTAFSRLAGSLTSQAFPVTTTPPTTTDGGSGVNVLHVDATSALSPVNTATPGIVSGQFATPGGPVTGAIGYSNYQTVIVDNNPSTPPVVTAANFSVYQGENLVDIPVATFTSADPGAKASDFTATIAWGDNSTSAGVIVQDAQNPSVFHVTGTHQYALQGSYNVGVSVLHSTSSQTTTNVNGTTIIINTVTPPGTTPVTSTSTATVNPSPLSVQAFAVTGTEGFPLDVATNQVLASFTDSGGPSTAADYTVTINWGDGSANFVGTPGQLITQTGTNSNGANFSVSVPAHHYNEEGQYTVTVTITNNQDVANPISASAASLALIHDAELNPAPVNTLTPTEGIPFVSNIVGSFTDTNTAGTVGDFTATIDWGDGSPNSIGHVETLLGSAPETYFVTGTHTYPNALANGTGGVFLITVSVRDAGGATVETTSLVEVQHRPFVVSGNLNSSSDSGVSDTDNVTNVTQPNFVGHSDPSSTVQLYAYTSTNPTPVLIGQGTTDSSGFWTVTPFSPLADGTYTIAALSTNSTGFTTETAVITPTLVIDTAGPVVTNVFFDRVKGQIDLTYQDNLSGVAGLTMVDAANYRLTRPTAPFKTFLVNKATATPDATNPLIQNVVLTFNDGRQIRGGRYLFTVKGTDPVNDVAGNALQGVFYSYFPSGNGHNGTDFVARLSGVHNRIFAPKTIFGTATPNTPPGTPSNETVLIPTANPFKASGNPNIGTAKVVHSAAKPHGHVAVKHHHHS